MSSMAAVDLARIQFAFTVSFHILFPAFTIGLASYLAVLEGLFGAEGKVEVGWVVESEKLPKGAVKLLLNLALLAGDALVRGGRLDVGAERADRAIELAVRAEGPRILLDPVLRETLATGGGNGSVEPRAAGAWLAHSLAAEGGGSLRLSDPSSEVLMIGATLPGA